MLFIRGTCGADSHGIWRPWVVFGFGVQVCFELVLGWDCDFDRVNPEFLVLILGSDDIPSLSVAAEGRLT